MRATMHNRVEADVFVTGGGLPDTVTYFNWREFLRTDGTQLPSAPLVVEGANLFFTDSARDIMHKHTLDNGEPAGIKIIKDSSANKCGVICSSFEILSRFILEKHELKDPALREQLIADVKVRLRDLAKVEAELLWREFEAQPTPVKSLPELSKEISLAINDTAQAICDAIEAEGKDAQQDELVKLQPLLIEHMPAKLRQYAHRIDEKLPQAYILSAASAALASRIIYREGTRFSRTIDKASLGKHALQWYEQSQANAELAGLVAGLEWGRQPNSADFDIKQRVLAVLRPGEDAASSLRK